jgi:O-antigen/teichoic acid export membrane protein
MPKPAALRYSFSWTFAGTTVYAVCQWGMLQVLACHGTPEIVGQFTLGLALVTPLTAFVDRTLRSLQASAARNEHRTVMDYLVFRALAGLASLAVIAAIVLVEGYRLATVSVISWVALLKLVEGLANVFFGRMHQHERMDLIARWQIVRGILGLLVFLITFRLAGSVTWSVMTVVGVHVAALLALCRDGFTSSPRTYLPACDGQSAVVPGHEPRFRTTELGSTSTRWRALSDIFWQGLPLGVASFLVALNSSIPRYMLEKYHGEALLGIFSVMFYFTLPLTMVVGAMTQTAIPRLARLHRDGRERESWLLLGKMSLLSLALGAFCVVATFAWGEPILQLLYRNAYANHAPLLMWVTLATAAGNVAAVPAVAVTARREFRSAVLICACSSVACAVLARWLVPSTGMTGTAVVMLLTNLIHGMASVAVLLWRGSMPALGERALTAKMLSDT